MLHYNHLATIKQLQVCDATLRMGKMSLFVDGKWQKHPSLNPKCVIYGKWWYLNEGLRLYHWEHVFYRCCAISSLAQQGHSSAVIYLPLRPLHLTKIDLCQGIRLRIKGTPIGLAKQDRTSVSAGLGLYHWISGTA